MLGAELVAHAIANTASIAAFDRPRATSSALQAIAGCAYVVDLLDQASSLHQSAADAVIGFVLNAPSCDYVDQPIDVLVVLTNGKRPTQASVTLNARVEALLPTPSGPLMSRVAALPCMFEMDASHAPESALFLVVKAVDIAQPLDVARLHADILAAGYLASERMRYAIRAAHVLLYSTDLWGREQDAAAANVYTMLNRGLPTTTQGNAWGYDAMSLCCMSARDATAGPNFLNARHHLPSTRQPLHYSHALREVSAHFRARFSRR